MWSNQYGSDTKKMVDKISNKDQNVMINNFEAAHRLLNCGHKPLGKSFREKLDLFFIDYDFVPLLVQESYLGAMQGRSEMLDIESMAEAAEFISLGD